MRIRDIFVVLFLTLCIQIVGDAQLLYDLKTGPGLNLDKFSSHSIEWVRSHHLRRAGFIDMSHNDTLWEYTFNYSGDTLIRIITRSHDGSEFIEKYDRRDSLLCGEIIDSFFWGKTIYDSMGRKQIEQSAESSLSRTKTHLKKPRIDLEEWQYVDFHGLNNRIDSTLLIDRSAQGIDMSRKDYFFYDSNNLLRYKHSVGKHWPISDEIDSFFYDSHGSMTRSSIYERKGRRRALCLWHERVYDTHGNIITEIKPSGRRCGDDLDTLRYTYQYDERGRPVAVVSEWDRDEYHWGSDDQLIDRISYYVYDNAPYKTGDVRGSLHYIYEF